MFVARTSRTSARAAPAVGSLAGVDVVVGPLGDDGPDDERGDDQGERIRELPHPLRALSRATVGRRATKTT